MRNLHIRSTIENFFICTNIPVKAFKFDTSLIQDVGFSDELNRLFSSNDILEKVKKEFLEKHKNSVVTINCKDNINFTACKICPCSDNEGFYIIGPYACDTVNPRGVQYKPGFCIPHLVSLLRNIERDISPIEITGVSPKPIQSLHIKKALNYINNNFHSPLTLDSLSDYVKINKSYLCEVLKKETGKTFSQLLNEIRIEKSKELLLEHGLSILEVSLSVGFNNQNYFNKIFKKFTNKTPLEFKTSRQ